MIPHAATLAGLALFPGYTPIPSVYIFFRSKNNVDALGLELSQNTFERRRYIGAVYHFATTTMSISRVMHLETCKGTRDGTLPFLSP